MHQMSSLIQNRLRETTVSLERAARIDCGPDWVCSASLPPYSSIGLILSGEGTICADSAELHPHAGQLYLLPANTNQSFFTDLAHPYRKYYCHFEITCQGNSLFDLLQFPLCVDAKDPAYARQLLHQMSDACSRNDVISALQGKCLLWNLFQHYLECCPAGSIIPIADRLDSPLSAAVSYVEQHLSEPVTVQQMAVAAGYHPSHFTRLFQKHMGLSPGQFILRKKTERAAELLTATALPVSAIADELGFGSPFYFSNFMKKQTGMTPSQYRKIYKRNGF